MLMMAKREILPACMEWEDKLARDIEKLDAAGTNFGGVQKIQLAKTRRACERAVFRYRKAGSADTGNAGLGVVLRQVRVFPRQNKRHHGRPGRAAADSLETIVSRKVWPIPTYADILFYE